MRVKCCGEYTTRRSRWTARCKKVTVQVATLIDTYQGCAADMDGHALLQRAQGGVGVVQREVSRHRQAARSHGDAQRAAAVGRSAAITSASGRPRTSIQPASQAASAISRRAACPCASVEARAGAGPHGAMGAGHGLDLDFVLMHHHHGALGLLTHHVTGAERAHGALGGLDQEGAARVGRHGHGDGAVQQAHLAIGGREVQVHRLRASSNSWLPSDST